MQPQRHDIIIVQGDTFEAVWEGLAARHGLGLVVIPSFGERYLSHPVYTELPNPTVPGLDLTTPVT